jgi:hypothetical protein
VTFLNTGDLTLGQTGGTQTYTAGYGTSGVGGTVTLLGNIDVGTGGTITMGAVTLGGSTEFNFNGTLAINGVITGGGNALTFSVANLTIGAAINGVSTLTIENIDPAGAIDLGGLGAASFVLSSVDLSNIQAGTDVVIGSSSYTGNMTVAGAWSNGLDVTLNFQNGGAGSLAINNAITGAGSLTVNGSGNTTTLNANVTQASITINDASLVPAFDIRPNFGLHEFANRIAELVVF